MDLLNNMVTLQVVEKTLISPSISLGMIVRTTFVKGKQDKMENNL